MDYEKEYAKKNRTWHIEDSQWKAQKIIGMMKENNLAPRSICEVGCGAGQILHYIQEAYPDVDYAGYDISSMAISMCQPRDRCQYYNADILETDDVYDLVLAIDLIEHVEDCYGFLKKLKAHGSKFIFRTPLDMAVLPLISGAIMATRDAVGHIHYFCKDTFFAALNDCGYNILDWRYTIGAGSPARTTVSKLLKMPRNIAGKVAPDIGALFLGGSSLLILSE